MAIRFVVDTEEEKQELLEASEYLHYCPVDTDLSMVNTLCHLYLAPHLIEVEPKE